MLSIMDWMMGLYLSVSTVTAKMALFRVEGMALERVRDLREAPCRPVASAVRRRLIAYEACLWIVEDGCSDFMVGRCGVWLVLLFLASF